MPSHEVKGSLYKTRGIVLKSIKLGEADKIIIFFTNFHGKVSAVAKGLRRTKSKFGGRLEPFTYVDLLLYKGRNLDTITQAEIITSFSEIREDLNKIAYGLPMLDLMNKVSIEREKDKRVFEFLLSSLKTLSKITINTDLLLVAFDLKLLSLSGFLPILNRCVVCSKTMNHFKETFFSCEKGGLICKECGYFGYRGGEVGPDIVFISSQAASLLSTLLRASAGDLDKIEVSEKPRKEVLTVVRKYVDFHIQAQLKSRECINKLKG